MKLHTRAFSLSRVISKPTTYCKCHKSADHDLYKYMDGSVLKFSESKLSKLEPIYVIVQPVWCQT